MSGPATGGPGQAERPERVPRPLADALVGELGSWLEGTDPAWSAAAARAWDASGQAAARRLITAHGLASFLVRDPAASRAVAALPDELQAWLAAQEAANHARIERLRADLGGILRGFAAAGIAVMPLKGSLLWERPGGDPYRRPMADLDLLVRPGDREAARATLTTLGYVRRPGRHRRPTHDTFDLPGNTRLVSRAGEDPDNPRPIELHVEVKRHLWGWVDDDDLTDLLWAGAAPGTVAGEPALVPSDGALLAHLAVHATSDLLLTRGRLIQLVDVADQATTVGSFGGLPHPRLVQPAIALAARRLPGRTATIVPAELTALAARVPRRLSRWAATVPLDTRAGLQSGRILPDDVNSLEARWSRWAPEPWRLAVAYGSLPVPLAAARHALRLARIASRRPT